AVKSSAKRRFVDNCGATHDTSVFFQRELNCIGHLRRRTMGKTAYKPISADSHVAEPPHCWADYIDPKWRDDAPRIVRQDVGDDHYVIKGFPNTLSMVRLTSAGWDLEQMARTKGVFDEVNPGGYDGRARLGDQDRDGVAGELIYPSIGMVICGLQDLDY